MTLPHARNPQLTRDGSTLYCLGSNDEIGSAWLSGDLIRRDVASGAEQAIGRNLMPLDLSADGRFMVGFQAHDPAGYRDNLDPTLMILDLTTGRLDRIATRTDGVNVETTAHVSNSGNTVVFWNYYLGQFALKKWTR